MFLIKQIDVSIDKKQTTKQTIKQTISKPKISGTLINLRPIVKADIQAMFDAVSNADEEGRKLTGSKRIFTIEGTKNFFARIVDSNDRVDYAITLKENPEYIGEVGLNNINFEERSADFRIVLDGQQYYNKGYGSEAATLILKHGFEALKLHRVELEVYDFNARALHVYEKIGFLKEGIRRDVLLWDGKYHNAITMSILEDEWFSKYSIESTN